MPFPASVLTTRQLVVSNVTGNAVEIGVVLPLPDSGVTEAVSVNDACAVAGVADRLTVKALGELGAGVATAAAVVSLEVNPGVGAPDPRMKF